MKSDKQPHGLPYFRKHYNAGDSTINEDGLGLPTRSGVHVPTFYTNADGRTRKAASQDRHFQPSPAPEPPTIPSAVSRMLKQFSPIGQ